MRILEPHMFDSASKHKKHRKRIKLVTIAGILLLLFVPTAIRQSQRKEEPVELSSVGTSSATSNDVAGAQTTEPKTKHFSDKQFHTLYESLALPNTEKITSPPEITGNSLADARIRMIAKKRGYELRSTPVLPIFKTNVPGLDEDDLLQPKAFDSWKKLQTKANKDGIALKLNSGYRSIDWQRRYFVIQLRARGITEASIANGLADSGVESVMKVVAPPGYSRHHTGYTVDFICKDGSGRAFEFTPCFTWLSKDNYEVPKKYGWIPSYPENATNQGPEPEPWEYVWVGTEATHE